jgi:sugar phosphate permease
MITRWFVAKRARALSFAQTGVSLGGVVLVPLTVGLVQSRGLETAARVLALLLLAVAVPVTLGVLRFAPEPFGLAPDGPGAAPPANPLLAPEHQLRRWTTREVLGTLSFWRLAVGFAGVLFAQQAVLIHEVAFLRERLDADAAALAVSTTAGGSIVARLAMGGIADRLEKRRVAVALVLFQAATLVGFTLVPGSAPLFACALALGFTIGNLFMMQSLLAGELFGLASFGRVFGTLVLVSQVAGGFGPVTLGLLFEGFGGYEVPFRILAGLDVAAAWILAGLLPPRGIRAD